VNSVDIILSHECVKQYRIIEMLRCKNSDFNNLALRFFMMIKSYQGSEDIDAVQLGIRDHGGTVLGRLNGKLSDVVSRDLDSEHRFTAFELTKNVVVVTAMTHYNFKFNNGGKLFVPIREQVDYISGLNEKGFNNLKQNQMPIMDNILDSVKCNLSNEDIATYNNNVMESNICPISVGTIKVKLCDFLKKENDNNIPLGQSLISFLSDDSNKIFLERATVNARAFSNAAAVVLSEKNLKDTLITKLDIDNNIFVQFADLIFSINKKLNEAKISVDIKEKIVSDLADGFLKAFDKSHNKMVEFENADICSFNFRHDYEIIRRMDEHLRTTVKLDLEKSLKKAPNFLALDHNRPKELYNFFFLKQVKTLISSIMHVEN
jgi:hypothetical protein